MDSQIDLKEEPDLILILALSLFPSPPSAASKTNGHLVGALGIMNAQ